MTCSASTEDESYEILTSTSCSASNDFSSSSNDSVSDDAASTVRSLPPESPPASSAPQAAVSATIAPMASGTRMVLERISVDLHHDIGCLDDCGGDGTGSQTEIVDGLAAQQRHHAVRPAAHLDLRHHGVTGHCGDDSPHAVTRARMRGAAAVIGQMRTLESEPCKVLSFDRRTTLLGASRGDADMVSPSAYGVTSTEVDDRGF